MKLNKSLKFVLYLVLLALVIVVARKVVQRTAPQGDIATSPKRIATMAASLTPKGWELYDKVMHFTPENLYEQINGRAEYYLAYDVKGVHLLSVDGIELLSCDMGGSYDVVFQKGRLVAGVTEVKDTRLAIEATIDLWKQLQTE